MSTRILTCVYCGQAYPQDTPAHGSSVLTEHIKVCPAHPMRKAESDIQMLRAALVGLIGAGEKAELLSMEAAIRIIPGEEADKVAALNAVHALLLTMPASEAVQP